MPMAMKTFTLRLTEAQKRLLDELAERLERPRAVLLRSSLDVLLKTGGETMENENPVRVSISPEGKIHRAQRCTNRRSKVTVTWMPEKELWEAKEVQIQGGGASRSTWAHIRFNDADECELVGGEITLALAAASMLREAQQQPTNHKIER